MAERTTTANTGDAELLASLRAGQDAAYEELIRAHGGRMLAAVRRILPTEEDAQDAVQEAFLSAFKKIDSFQGHSKLGTWLHRIAINSALMKLRSMRRRTDPDVDGLMPRFLDGGHFVEMPRRWSEAADAPVVLAEIRAAVHEGIESLPENYRVALLLRDIEGLNNTELADQLGVSINAARIRVHRARLALREVLDPHLAEESE